MVAAGKGIGDIASSFRYGGCSNLGWCVALVGEAVSYYW
jgi:hypothetical protein